MCFPRLWSRSTGLGAKITPQSEPSKPACSSMSPPSEYNNDTYSSCDTDLGKERPGVGHSDEPPPAYTPGPAQPMNTDRSPPAAIGTDADPYAFLASFDTAFLIDDSGSMIGSRSLECENVRSHIVQYCSISMRTNRTAVICSANNQLRQCFDAVPLTAILYVREHNMSPV
jgi:hypothetical protein